MINKDSLKVFTSYNRKDVSYLNDFQEHLVGLKQNGLIQEWNDHAVMPGEEWARVVKKKISESDIIVFLVSSDFIASDYIHDIEINKAIERHKRGESIIIPVIIRPCDFQSLPISKFQALPRYARPISTWEDKKEAWLDVTRKIERLATGLKEGKVQLRQKSIRKPVNGKAYLNGKSTAIGKRRIKKKIAGGNIKSVLSELLDLTADLNDDDFNAVLLIASRFKNVEKNIQQGLISNQEASIREASITHSLLNVIDQLHQPIIK